MIVLAITVMNVAAVIGMFLASRSALRGWRLAMRRELLLAEACQRYDAVIRAAVETGELDASATVPTVVAVADELHNQERHRHDRFRMPPQLGRPWPDFEPAAIEVERDES